MFVRRALFVVCVDIGNIEVLPSFFARAVYWFPKASDAMLGLNG